MPDDPHDAELRAQLEGWRESALEAWSKGVEITRRDDVLERRLNQSQDRIKDLQKKVRTLRARAEEAEARVRDIEGSTSWRVTGALRRATDVARRARRAPRG